MKCVLLTMPKYADGVSFLAYSYIPLKYEPRNESRLSSYTGGSSDNLSEQIKAAYEKYVNQNKNQDGKVTE